MGAVYSAHAIANRFLQLAQNSGRQLTNMQLQKLVFLAHGFALGLLNRPLTFHNVHAWQFGPVIPKLYKSLQAYGNGTVTAPLKSPSPDQDALLYTDDEAKAIIAGVWNAYGQWNGSKLSALTHLPESPWDIVWNQEGRRYDVIPNEIIREHYAEMQGA
ncbi:MAG: DUF4065 domain-containing protein [Burkholderiaceae bacterium]|nr:DUF4065 domain-containing protein [Burkholderiaceae bacterium]